MNLASMWKDPIRRVRMWGGLALVTLLVMESTTDSLWYQALFNPRETGWGAIFLILLAVLGISAGLAHGMERLKWKMLLRQVVFAGWLLVAIFTSLKLLVYPHTQISLLQLVSMPVRYFILPDVEDVNFFHLLAITLLVWRGVTLARGPVALMDAQFSFQVGLMALLLYGMLFAMVHPVEATLGMYDFLFFGLITMSLARLANLSELRGGRIPRFGGGWLASIVLAALAVVALALLAGWLTSGQIAAFMAWFVIIFLAALTALTLFLMGPFLEFLARFLVRLADVIQQFLNQIKNLANNPGLQKIIEQVSESLGKIIPVMLAGRALILIAVISLVVIAIMVGLRMRNVRQDPIEEEQVDTGEGDPIENPLRNLLRRLFPDGLNLRLRTPGQMLAAARVRRIYRQLMALSEKLGTPRPPSRTPFEFLAQLETLFPGEQAGLSRITGAYVQVRYGEFPENLREVTEVEAAWERVRQAGRQALLLQRKSKQQK